MLWPLSNSCSESYNKTLNQQWKHTTRQGANGRVSEIKKLQATAAGEEWRGKAGRAQECNGLRAAAERLVLVYYYTFEEQILFMREEDQRKCAGALIGSFAQAVRDRAAYLKLRDLATQEALLAASPCASPDSKGAATSEKRTPPDLTPSTSAEREACQKRSKVDGSQSVGPPAARRSLGAALNNSGAG